MGKVITVMNMKGGVGKTTVTAHLGGIIARYAIEKKCRKVLLIDYDPQFNLSQAYLPPEIYFELDKKRKTILSVLIEDDSKIDPFHLQVPGNEVPPAVEDLAHTIFSFKDGRKLDIITSTLDLMYVALGHFDKSTKIIEERFTKFIDSCRSSYDLIFIDCHPAGSLFTKTSLRNSDHVLIPVAPQPYAVRGIGLMMRFIEAKKTGNIGPKPHILFNLTQRRRTSKDETDIRNNPRFAKYCMTSRVNYYGVLTDLIEGKGYLWYSKKPYSTEALGKILRVAEEIVKITET